MSDYETIHYSVDNAVGRIVLAQPKVLNAFSPLMIAEMKHALGRVVADGARVLVLSGEGRAFCSGVSLTGPDGKSNLDGDVGGMLDTCIPLILALQELPIPIISTVNGLAAGAGCAISLSADFVIASDDAYFLMAFVRLGLAPDMGASWILQRLVGLPRATELIMLGEKLDAQKALDWGMIFKVVERDQLSAAGDELATRLAGGPTVAYATIRRVLRRSLSQSLVESMQEEKRGLLGIAKTNDFREGVAAFIEKRPATFEGR